MTGAVTSGGPASASAPAKIDPALRKAAQGFEEVIVRQLIASMREAKLADGMFASSATDNFRELADARTAESIAKLGQFGIAGLVEKQLEQAERAKP